MRSVKYLVTTGPAAFEEPFEIVGIREIRVKGLRLTLTFVCTH